ncbi:substrate-binding domain-containing protein [Lentzea sp. NEAU-D13]|uniref:Substrate-binding domain-containing protein n=1 Tax=Lentzea alba TaxID=2714351 RepID=A0A7C9VT12_9PSEU|nr:substrate-binding domain-containing protein [Lentzea alba]NGY62212.1 substrate-binding domain-containing protein [Lentzea alba]
MRSVNLGSAPPPLTTVRMPFADLGSKAVELLLARLRGDQVPDSVTLSPELVVRPWSTVRASVVACCARLRENTGLNAVALFGGVFQNALMLLRVSDGLHRNGFRVLTRRQTRQRRRRQPRPSRRRRLPHSSGPGVSGGRACSACSSRVGWGSFTTTTWRWATTRLVGERSRGAVVFRLSPAL